MKQITYVWLILWWLGGFSLLPAQSQDETSSPISRKAPLPVASAEAAKSESAASDTAKTPGQVVLRVQVKSSHLWRGFRVTDAPMVGTNAAYVFPGGHWETGFWGGGGFTGEYREFDYYISFAKNGFRVALWDIYNFSDYMPTDRRLFDYDGATTLHFIDLSVGYQFGKAFPLDVSVATILYGRDRNIIEIQNGAPRREDRDRFSTYVQLTYPVYDREAKINLYVAGAFALNGDQAHFYGSKPNIVNMGVEVSKTFDVNGYQVPASATAMWNPEANFGAVQLALTLF
jgi:hypothetical protein